MNAISIHEEKISFELLVAEKYDELLQVLIWWYKEESDTTEEIPNLYWVLFDEHRYANMFFDVFVESLCWQRYHLGVGKIPDGDDFFLADFERTVEEVVDCFEHYLPIIQRDVEKVLNNMQLSYSLYNPYEGNGPMESDIGKYYRNINVQEVW